VRSEDQPEAGEASAEGAPDEPHRQRTTMDDDLPVTDDVLVRHEEEEAAEEAAHIGGAPPPVDSDEASRPLEEAGEGVAEGYEQAEQELIEEASHGEDRWVPEPFPSEGGEDRLPADAAEHDRQELLPEASTDRVQPSYGDPDAIAPTEVRTDSREDAPEPDEAPLVTSEPAGVAPAPGEQGPPGDEASGEAGDEEAVERGALRRRVAQGLSISRVALGGAYLVAPRLAGPTWIGRAASLSGTRVVTAGLGARDVALGLGTLLAGDDHATRRTWLRAQLASDLADFAAMLVHGRGVDTSRRLGALAVIGGAAAAGGFAAFGPEE
jgi:hypothetical protein